MEEEKVDVLALENGLWNRVSAADVQAELGALSDTAREKAKESGLPAQAEETLRKQLDARIQSPQPLRIVFDDEHNGRG